jgi:hypothetical protein
MKYPKMKGAFIESRTWIQVYQLFSVNMFCVAKLLQKGFGTSSGNASHNVRLIKPVNSISLELQGIVLKSLTVLLGDST